MVAHVVWLKDEGGALKFSSTYGQRAKRRIGETEKSVKLYLNSIHKALAKLK